MLPPSPIRLFVDAHCFDQEYQGSRRFVQGLYQELSHFPDLEIYMAAYDTNNLHRHFPLSNTIRFIQYRSRSKYFRLAYDIPVLIKKYKSHIAHFQYITPAVKNCKQVVTIHDLLFRDYPKEFPLSYRIIRNYLFRRAARQANLVTTVSDYSKTSIQQHYQPAGQVTVIPNAVDHSFFVKTNRQAAASNILSKYGINKFILCVSRIEPRKNQVALLKAFLELELYKKDYHLVLAGHTSIRVTGLEILLKNLPAAAQNKVHLFEQLKENELMDFYQAAEVFVYPSKAEGFGLPPLEAAAVQVPVICSNSTAMKDFDFFGENLIDASDPASLTERLSELLDKRPEQTKLLKIANEIALLYSWKQSAKQFHDLIIKHCKTPLT